MEKRIEQKKQKIERLRKNMQRLLAVFFCIGLLIFFITATDISTRRMIMCDDDMYALSISLQEGDMLRLDIAGEKYMLNIESVVMLTDTVVSGSKRCYESIVSFIRGSLN